MRIHAGQIWQLSEFSKSQNVASHLLLDYSADQSTITATHGLLVGLSVGGACRAPVFLPAPTPIN